MQMLGNLRVKLYLYFKFSFPLLFQKNVSAQLCISKSFLQEYDLAAEIALVCSCATANFIHGVAKKN